uniref:Uncharacterized protein n=1 Tax=Anopheles merus TaxID=30066 RepID=A0A182VD56_ANOME
MKSGLKLFCSRKISSGRPLNRNGPFRCVIFESWMNGDGAKAGRCGRGYGRAKVGCGGTAGAAGAPFHWQLPTFWLLSGGLSFQLLQVARFLGGAGLVLALHRRQELTLTDGNGRHGGQQADQHYQATRLRHDG